MRVISQDGTVDIPYDETVFTVNDTYIHAYHPATQTLLVARYSSDEKADRAMEMMREACTGNPFILQNIEAPQEEVGKLKNILRDCVVIMTRDEQPPRFERITEIVFQFPEDDEVEV